MIIYLIKVNIVLVLMYVLYRLFFYRLTFFRFNRFFLISALLLSVLMPLLHIPQRVVQSEILDYSLGIPWDEFAPIEFDGSESGITSASFSFISVLFMLVLFIAVIRLLGLLIGYIRALNSYRGGIVKRENGIRWKVHKAVNAPFTLFRTIYLDEKSYEISNSVVLRHEMVHARQLHSLDVLIAEIICACLWFNPFVFLLRRRIKENHEFLADSVANTSNQNLIEYMLTMSSELYRSVDPAFASHFKSSTIKKRIIMLTNKKSNKNRVWTYITVLPLLAILLMAFQQPVENVLPKEAVLNIMSAEAKLYVPGEAEIPSRFPMDLKFKQSITWNYGIEAKNPITGKMMTHNGVDIKAPKGTPIYATGNGIVAKAISDHEGYGKVVALKHQENMVSLYAHMDSYNVKVGQKVNKGDKIGEVGNTGKSTGPHLHYEVRKDGENVNPADYF